MNFETLKQNLAELSGVASAKIAERQRLAARAAALAAAPATLTDLKNDLFGYVDNLAAHYPRALASTLKPYQARANKRLGDYGPVPVLTESTPTRPIDPAALMFLLSDPIKAGIARALAEMPEHPDAVPRAARAAELATLERQVAALDAELVEMGDAAAAVGIRIPQRPLTPAELDAARREDHRARLTPPPVAEVAGWTPTAEHDLWS